MLYFLGDLATCVLDLLLSGEEHEDVARRLARMDLDDCPDGSLEVIPLRVLEQGARERDFRTEELKVEIKYSGYSRV